MPPIERAEVGMRVELHGPTDRLPSGSLGTIDLVSLSDPSLFWVLTDDGGFWGWTSWHMWRAATPDPGDPRRP